jgi:hypothetical protein
VQPGEAATSNAGRGAFRESAVELRGRDRYGLIIAGKHEVHAIGLSQFIVAAIETKQYAIAVIGNQS